MNLAHSPLVLRSSVDRAPARCLGGHRSNPVGESDFFCLSHARDIDYFIFSFYLNILLMIFVQLRTAITQSILCVKHFQTKC